MIAYRQISARLRQSVLKSKTDAYASLFCRAIRPGLTVNAAARKAGAVRRKIADLFPIAININFALITSDVFKFFIIINKKLKTKFE